jgi:hypothetical protein
MRKAEARARYAGLETAVLEKMWIREERVDWAEAALHEELLARDVDFEGMAARVAGPAPVAPEWLKPLEAAPPADVTANPTSSSRFNANRVFIPAYVVLFGLTIWLFNVVLDDHSMTASVRHIVLELVVLSIGGLSVFRIRRSGFRSTLVVTWSVGLLAASLIWAVRPTRPVDAPSVMEGMGVPGQPNVTANEQHERAVRQMRGAMETWRRQYNALDDHSVVDAGPSPWEPQRFTGAPERAAVAQEMLEWRSEVAARVAIDDTLVADLQRAIALLPEDMRVTFRGTVAEPSQRFVAAEKQRLGVLRQQVLLVDQLSAFAARQPPVVDAKTGKATFAGRSASEYARILAQRDALLDAEDHATQASNTGYESFVRDAAQALGALGDD